MEKKNEKYPEGHFVGIWMGIGIAIFSGVGVPLSIVLKIDIPEMEQKVAV
jgi:hypothetical protein